MLFEDDPKMFWGVSFTGEGQHYKKKLKLKPKLKFVAETCHVHSFLVLFY